MAENIKSIGSGKDHETIAAWHDDYLTQAGSFPSGNDEVAECYGTFTETGNTAFNAGAQGANELITIRPASGQQHLGLWADGKATIQCDAAGTDNTGVITFKDSDHDIIVENMQIEHTMSDSKRIDIKSDPETAGRIYKFRRNIFKALASSGLRERAFKSDNNGGGSTWFYRNIIVDYNEDTAIPVSASSGDDDTLFYHNTGIGSIPQGNTAGFYISTGNVGVKWKNNYSGFEIGTPSGDAYEEAPLRNCTTADNVAHDATSPDSLDNYNAYSTYFVDHDGAERNVKCTSDTTLKLADSLHAEIPDINILPDGLDTDIGDALGANNYYVGAHHYVVAGVTVSCILGTVEIAGLNATVTNDTDISATLGTVSISGLNVSVQLDTLISASLGQLAISGLNASVIADTLISASLGTVEIAGLNATVTNDTDIACSLGQVTVTGLNATVQAGQEVQCNPGQVTVAGYQATINAEIQISCTLGQVTIAGFNASITIGTKISSSLGTVAIAGLNVSIATGILIEPTTGVLVIAGYLADVFIGFPEVETPAARVMIVKNELRTLIIENENRTLTIKQ